MIEVLSNIVQTTLESFDFAYCIIVNILTYFAICIVNDKRPNHPLGTWGKRVVLIIVIIVIGVIYFFIGSNTRIILNSAIIAPVFWSWILKPICKHFKIDYKQIGVVD